jgi:hypothetical protein
MFCFLAKVNFIPCWIEDVLVKQHGHIVKFYDQIAESNWPLNKNEFNLQKKINLLFEK